MRCCQDFNQKQYLFIKSDFNFRKNTGVVSLILSLIFQFFMNKNQLVLNDLTWRTQARFSPAKYQFAQSNEDLHQLHLGFPPHCDSQHR